MTARTVYISGPMFRIWLNEMRMSGRIKYEKDAAQALDVSTFSIRQFKKHGADRRTALACMALVRDLSPYGQPAPEDLLPESRHELHQRAWPTEA